MAFPRYKGMFVTIFQFLLFKERAKIAFLQNVRWILLQHMSVRKIFFCILEWTNNPAVILVETTDYPVDLIPFPSVTVCQEDNSLNPWNFLEKLLNFIKYPCYEDDEYALPLRIQK